MGPMVVLDQNFEQSEAARRIMRALGVSECTLDAAQEGEPEIDWRPLVQELDGVFMTHGGTAGQFWFLHSATDLLHGRTPVETLSEPGGALRVRHAARAFANVRTVAP